MTKRYHTVVTAKVVDSAQDSRARRAIDSCSFLTPSTEAAIDLALGFGNPEPIGVLADSLCGLVRESEEAEKKVVDIMNEAGPSAEEIAEIEEEKSVDAPR